MVARAFFALLLTLFAATSALAEDSNPKIEFEKAARFFKAGEHEAALPHFRRAYELSNHRPSTILGLAQCERALKLYDDAVAHFKEYLASKPAPSDSASVSETMRMVEELRSEMNAEPGAAKVETPQSVKEVPPEAPPAPPEGVSTEPTQAPATESHLVPPPPRQEESGSIVESPVFWIVTGLVVVAGGTALVFALRSGKENPYAGSSGVFIQGP